MQCLSTSTIDENNEQVPTIIMNKRRVATEEVADHIPISHSSTYKIMHKQINIRTS